MGFRLTVFGLRAFTSELKITVIFNSLAFTR